MTKTTAIATRSDPLAGSVAVDPRVRMKEIRAEVAAFLKGNTFGMTHLADLPTNWEDARRVIIATQDLLETEREKHRKATLHICELVSILNGMSEVQQELMTMVGQRDCEIGHLRQLNHLHEQEIVAIRREAQTQRHERDAVLTTMKLLNSQPAQAGYNATRPLPMMAMGLSNKDRI